MSQTVRSDCPTPIEPDAHVEDGTGTIPVVKVSAKGQVTIPKELRDALGIGAGTEVEFKCIEDTLVMRKSEIAPRRGARLVQSLRGRGDVDMTTDEIMAITRHP